MLYLFITFIVVFFDQFSKYQIIKNINYMDSIEIINNILFFTHVRNKGAAFSILWGKQTMFIIISITVILLIIYYIYFTKLNNIYKIVLSLILGGALGNFIDRVFRGYVIDFIDIRIWPVFNLSDCFISIGATLLFILVILKKDGEEKLEAL